VVAFGERRVHPVKLAGDSSLASAVGSTVYSDPTVKQAVERVHSGELSSLDFMRLYSGVIGAKRQEAQVKQGPAHGFDKKTTLQYMQSLIKK
jgi:hypothetical protein